MNNKKKAEDSIQRLFFHPENRYNFELLYKYLSETQSHEGFLLCKVMPAERNRVLSFFRKDPTRERIQFINMGNPLIDTIHLQETIAAAHEKIGNKKDIFFIYNIEDCIERLKAGERDFFERLNLIRDFFMRYSSVFVFFMTEWLVKEMIRNAFDFYDWIKLTFTFIPEVAEKKMFQVEPEIQKYSNPHEKIEYLKTKIEKVKEPQRRFPLLNELGMLYYQIGNYDLALQYTGEALDILEMSTNRRTYDLAGLYNNLSMIYQAMGQPDKALSFAEKAVEILTHLFPNGHPDLTKAKQNLELIKKMRHSPH